MYPVANIMKTAMICFCPPRSSPQWGFCNILITFNLQRAHLVHVFEYDNGNEILLDLIDINVLILIR